MNLFALKERITRDRGFTLLEMVVVIAFVAVLSGIISFSVGTINSDTRLSNAATRALADVRHAQEMAMANRREVDIYVYPASNKYEIKWHDDGSYLKSPADGEDFIVQFAQGDYPDVTISSTGLGGRLSFTDVGSPLNGGSNFSGSISVMNLNSRIHVSVYDSGFLKLEETVGSGCGGC